MKTILMIFGILIIFDVCNAQKTDNQIVSIKNEIDSFIRVVKPMSLGEGEHNVYVIKILNRGDTIYMSIGYIMNTYNLRYINVNFFAKTESELLIINSDSINLPILNFESTSTINDRNINIIKEKLNHESGVFLSGSGQGEILKITNGKLQKKFFNNIEDMPDVFKFYDIDKLWERTIIKEIVIPQSSK